MWTEPDYKRGQQSQWLLLPGTPSSSPAPAVQAPTEKARLSQQDQRRSASDLISSSDDSLSTWKSRLRAHKQRFATITPPPSKNAHPSTMTTTQAKQPIPTHRPTEDVSKKTQSETTWMIRSKVQSEMSSMRTELIQMQTNIHEYHATQASFVDTVQMLQEDSKERGAPFS